MLISEHIKELRFKQLLVARTISCQEKDLADYRVTQRVYENKMRDLEAKLEFCGDYDLEANPVGVDT